jgi:mRNA-degrading endonuclease RelE of RelBE toxin-antitoxin system
MSEGGVTTKNTGQRIGYHVLIEPKVVDDLKSINTNSRTEIVDALKLIKYVKRPFNGERLIGSQSEYYKHSVGEYVVMYKFSEDGNAMVIIKITQRKSKGFEGLFY